MPPPRLYKICLQRICNLLKIETWKNYATNPFWLHKSPVSDLPTEIIDDLMQFAGQQSENMSIADVLLLLTSGKLTRLDLSSFDLQKDYHAFQRVIHSKGCRSLRLLIRHSVKKESPSLMETFISTCQNLEVLDVKGIDCDTIISALENCPKLISIKQVDILDALEIIRENCMNGCTIPAGMIRGHFQLRKCVWGRPNMVIDYENPRFRSRKNRFLDKIRAAVILCPLVENLLIYAQGRDSLKALKELKRLAVLEINLCNCDDTFLPHFIELLEVIGPQLKHLVVYSELPLPVDVICCSCPNLQMLDIYGKTTASNTAESKDNLLLKTLTIMTADESALLFLLSTCKRLENLVIRKAKSLDDYLLVRILEINPLSYLKWAKIRYSKLSKYGTRKLVKKKPPLQRAYDSFFKKIHSL